jgi:hypothetical protein
VLVHHLLQNELAEELRLEQKAQLLLVKLLHQANVATESLQLVFEGNYELGALEANPFLPITKGYLRVADSGDRLGWSHDPFHHDCHDGDQDEQADNESHGDSDLAVALALPPGQENLFPRETTLFARFVSLFLCHGSYAFLVADEGQQSQVARTLDRCRQAALVFGAGAGLPAGADAAMLGHIAPQRISVFVVNCLNLVYTEGTDAAAPEPSPSTTKISHCFLQMDAS